MFLIVTVPVILGMIFRGFASNAAIKFEPVAKKISIGLFLSVIGTALYNYEGILFSRYQGILGISFRIDDILYPKSFCIIE